jgi:hypothetical protein
MISLPPRFTKPLVLTIRVEGMALLIVCQFDGGQFSEP